MIIPFYNPSDKYIKKSEGCYVYDSEGKKYIDFESGVWCVNLGHNHPAINKKIKAQLDETTHQGYYFKNKEVEKLAQKLHQIMNFEGGKSVFLSSGSEAVNLSITLAKAITGRNQILTTNYSYLSAYGHGQNIQANNNLITTPLNDLEAIKKIDFNQIAAFVLETGGASLGVVRFPETSFIEELVKIARKNNTLIIANEVTTGMGRTGKWFGFQHYNVLPDMVATGKGMGNGYPVSAVSVSAKIAEEFAKEPFRYAQSHQNDPLGCAVGLEVIRILEEENWIVKGKQTGLFFKNTLEDLKEKHTNKIKEVRARGMTLAIEFNAIINAEKLAQKLFEAGFIIGCKNNTLRFMPPLVLSKKDIITLVEKLDKLLA